MSNKIEALEVETLIRETLRIFTKKESAADQQLFGPGGVLESIQLVAFLISLEQQIQASTGHDIRIASDKAFSAKDSPFRSTVSLREWVLTELSNERLR